MSATVPDKLGDIDLDTRIQYGLMFLFGALCLVAAIAPLGTLIKAVTVAALFGLTAGIWISHLVQTIQKAASAPTGRESG
ncbi:hypothetical protein [Haloarcula halophila]|uniref:hypothetical protein n=1 Tax=Haloarcula TaxID=2237 RepID=UPI0023E3D348|nr:hypothetical protein [Halomicroarcula sp. DFY41]